jgi:hypothetical protein
MAPPTHPFLPNSTQDLHQNTNVIHFCKVRGMAALRHCFAEGGVMPSCSGGGNVVVACSSSL